MHRSRALDPQATKFLAVAPNILSLFITGCPLYIKKRENQLLYIEQKAPDNSEVYMSFHNFGSYEWNLLLFSKIWNLCGSEN